MEFILSFWQLLVSTKEKINFYQSNGYLVIRETIWNLFCHFGTY